MPSAQLVDFAGLKYYEVDPEFKVEAVLSRFDEQELIEVPTTAGTTDPYTRMGLLTFELSGVELTLEAWRPEGGRVTNRLFVAFTDATSGGETYGGGRYLSLFLDKDDSVTIDFNLAHNPYCVYDPTYICPVAPPENRLPIPIAAGEKNWK